MNGYFDKYIQKYEYTYKCFDKGNDFFEEEALITDKLYPVTEYEIIRTAYYCTNCGGYVENESKNCPHCKVKLDWNTMKIRK